MVVVVIVESDALYINIWSTRMLNTGLKSWTGWMKLKMPACCFENVSFSFCTHSSNVVTHALPLLEPRLIGRLVLRNIGSFPVSSSSILQDRGWLFCYWSLNELFSSGGKNNLISHFKKYAEKQVWEMKASGKLLKASPSIPVQNHQNIAVL